MPNILVVEDDKALNKLICRVLERNGHAVFSACGGEEALSLLDGTYIDLVLTDIMMPGTDGYELVAAIRAADTKMPVIFITAKSGFGDKLRGFNLGADDYMVKPIDINELVLRVNAILRRSRIANERRLVIGSTVLDADSFTVSAAGSTSALPQKEFLLLFKLLVAGRHFLGSDSNGVLWKRGGRRIAAFASVFTLKGVNLIVLGSEPGLEL